ncbi:NAD-dependent epimerase/dehydratase family protein [Rhodococcus sp. H29-C3]|uniref:NAD-dependent epimerase/dehydratase family protein n=1 Tax=Rhodococcus sp. H29-C3 TaxID=3046307 RepID=UPI0024B9066B|nr:NAD-dependent epimerase/dehydratase family protein [Rhodococcus sp. H29-C3]MDJ0358756.1 SDR family NAD(P)-dependent oxidoreductase [Rhodococcus sp. H29-C3]
MRVLVTGGTGFVGAWTAKAAVDAGHEVRFLVRNPDRLQTSAAQIGLDVSDFRLGDITDADSISRAMDGCDSVVHAAAVVATDPSRAEEMIATNMLGAENVLGTAAALGLDPIVHVSSFTALFRPELDMLRADLPVVGGTDAYGRTKSQVDLYARGMQDGGAPVVITYPGMVLGPPAGDQFGEAADGVESALKMRMLPGRSAAWTVVDVRDLAAVHAALLEPGRGPRRYMVGGKRIPIASIAEMLRKITGTTVLPVPVPDVALRLLGRASDIVDSVSPIETPVSRSPISEAAMQYYTQMPPSDDSPSEEDLGVHYRGSLDTLDATVAGLRSVGRL